MKLNRVFKFFLLALTAGVILFQLGWAGQNLLKYTGAKIWPDRHLDAVSRSADVAYGSDFLTYIDFVRKETPPDAVVVDTRTFGAPQYDISIFLQYFLLPRRVTIQTDSSCPGVALLKDCLQVMTGPHVYFIYGSAFVIPLSVPDTLKVLPFNATMGVLIPNGAGAGQ